MAANRIQKVLFLATRIAALLLLTACAAAPPPSPSVTVYSTRFEVAENPISDGGKWVTGKAIGLDWNDPLAASGKAFASVVSGSTGKRYDDSIGHLSSAFSFKSNQYAQATVSRAPGYSPKSKHEIELLLRFRITPHNARGYEILWGHEGDLAIVRWNGPYGDYTVLDKKGRGPGSPTEGDVLRAEIIGSVIRIYKNGSLVATASEDATWKDGQPGMGFWPVESSTPANYAWKSYEAGNL